MRPIPTPQGQPGEGAALDPPGPAAPDPITLRFPWETGAVTTPRRPSAPRARPRGRRPAGAPPAASPWLSHHLTVSGPAAAIADFAAAARGAGITPWQLDVARLEEDVFHLAAAQPPATRRLSIAGCHILARQFAERVVARQARAIARVGHSRACPFDLHALLPIPDFILCLGPTHPDALAWLTKHWGTEQLRRVVERPPGQRPPAGHAVLGYGFCTARQTPHPAIAQLAARWTTLRFHLTPRPAD